MKYYLSLSLYKVCFSVKRVMQCVCVLLKSRRLDFFFFFFFLSLHRVLVHLGDVVQRDAGRYVVLLAVLD